MAFSTAFVKTRPRKLAVEVVYEPRLSRGSNGAFFGRYCALFEASTMCTVRRSCGSVYECPGAKVSKNTNTQIITSLFTKDITKDMPKGDFIWSTQDLSAFLQVLPKTVRVGGTFDIEAPHVSPGQQIGHGQCLKHRQCIRKPGHKGRCMRDSNGEWRAIDTTGTKHRNLHPPRRIAPAFLHCVTHHVPTGRSPAAQVGGERGLASGGGYKGEGGIIPHLNRRGF